MPGRVVVALGAVLGLLWVGSTVAADAKARHAAGTHARPHNGQRGTEHPGPGTLA